MEEQRNIPKSSHTNTVAAIAFSILGAYQLWGIWQAHLTENVITVWTVAFLVMYVVYALILFVGKQNKLLLIPAIVQVGLGGKSIVQGFSKGEIGGLFITQLIEVLIPVILIAMLFLKSDKVKKIWWLLVVLPVILIIGRVYSVGRVAYDVSYMITGSKAEAWKEMWEWAIPMFTPEIIRSMIIGTIGIVAYGFTGTWLAYPTGFSKKEIVTSGTSNTEEGLKMKFCSHCGKEIMDAAVVCPHCGCAVGPVNNEPDIPSTGLNVLSLLIPLVGLILYLVYHDKAPNKAKAIGKFALIGVGICVVLYILNIALISSMLY